MQKRTTTQKRTKELQTIINERFWSGNLSAEKWRRAVKKPVMSHKSLIKTSFERIPSSVLVDEMGENIFINRWPEIRSLFSPANQQDKKRVLLFDGIWGILTTGDSQYPVSSKIAQLSKARRALLAEIVKNPGMPIYKLQKQVARPYSRVFKDVMTLVELSLVNIEKEVSNGRQVSRLFSTESINTKLYKKLQNTL